MLTPGCARIGAISFGSRNVTATTMLTMIMTATMMG